MSYSLKNFKNIKYFKIGKSTKTNLSWFKYFQKIWIYIFDLYNIILYDFILCYIIRIVWKSSRSNISKDEREFHYKYLQSNIGLNEINLQLVAEFFGINLHQ